MELARWLTMDGSPAGRDTGTKDVVGGPEARDRSLTGTTLGTLPNCLPASWAPTSCGETLGTLSLPPKEADREQNPGEGATGAAKDLGKRGPWGFLGCQKVSNRGCLPCCSPSPCPCGTSTPAPPLPLRRPHLRRSSGGGTPRRRFTHCWSWLMELLRWAILSGLACGGKLGRRPPLSESWGGKAVLPGRLGEPYCQPLGWGGRSPPPETLRPPG